MLNWASSTSLALVAHDPLVTMPLKVSERNRRPSTSTSPLKSPFENTEETSLLRLGDVGLKEPNSRLAPTKVPNFPMCVAAIVVSQVLRSRVGSELQDCGFGAQIAGESGVHLELRTWSASHVLLHAVHTLLLVDVGATLWYSVLEHSSNGEQTVLPPNAAVHG